VSVECYCPVCRRSLYVADGDAPVCPVCSSPLIGREDGDRDEPSSDGGGLGLAVSD
jgi:hypothetical protein